MKAKNSLLLFVFSVFLGSCFDSPDFSPVPNITFEHICFGKSLAEFKPDSLVITLAFEDGDGNLGIPSNYNEYPFHELDYFVGDQGTLIPLGKATVFDGFPRFLNVPASVNGKLLVKSSINDPLYADKLVPYNSDSACIYYNRIDSILLKTADKRLLTEDMDYYEIPIQNSPDPNFTSVVVVKDTFFVKKNPNYQNIDVRFYRKTQDPNNPSGTVFTYVNWNKIFCTEIFDARFPVLSDPAKENALSGTITYSMTSTELETIMGQFIWKIRVQVRDRALNVSEPVWSKEFTLDEIRGVCQ